MPIYKVLIVVLYIIKLLNYSLGHQQKMSLFNKKSPS